MKKYVFTIKVSFKTELYLFKEKKYTSLEKNK